MHCIPLSLLCVLSIAICFVYAEWDNDTTPIAIFRSRPDLQAPVLTPLEGYHNKEKLAPGYYFVAPFTNSQEAIYIYDNDLNLVYSSFGSAGPGVFHNPQVCDYKHEKHLCFYQGVQMTGWGHGHGVIMNKHYQVVKSVEPAGTYQASSDMHEFMLIENGTRALMTQYLREVYDLCAYDLCSGLGYIQSGVFQEVDVETGNTVFAWKSLDHIDPDESYVPPSSTEISGSGEYMDSPWDYFHINSVDKSPDGSGDYLISARHTDAVYRISGKDGHVIWRLHGTKSDYQLDGFSFSSQHDARWIEDNDDYSIITIFDNGSNGFTQTQPHSTGLLVHMDHKTKIAKATKILDPPFVDGHAHISKSQGNYQTLPNGNIILGWGNDPFWTEYTSSGEIAFYGALAFGYMMNYRVHKFDEWVGIPLTKPALWSFSKSGWGTEADRTNPNKMSLYASWNGHTQIVSWTFFGSNNRDGPWSPLAEVGKEGFETVLVHPESWHYTYVEAFDEHAYSLGKSVVVETFVPGSAMRDYCDDLACRFIPDAETREKEKLAQNNNSEESLPVSQGPVVDQQAIYIGSFVFLAVAILGLTSWALRHYISTPVEKTLRLFGFRTRRLAESTKGRYAGIGGAEAGRFAVGSETDMTEEEMGLMAGNASSTGIEDGLMMVGSLKDEDKKD